MSGHHLCADLQRILAVLMILILAAVTVGDIHAQESLEQRDGQDTLALADAGQDALDFSVDTSSISSGESITLRWRVADADAGDVKVRLWRDAGRPTSPEPLNWWAISELGEVVEASGERELSLAETTAFYLIVKTRSHARGSRLVVHVTTETSATELSDLWSPPASLHRKMERAPHVGWTRPAVSDRLLTDTSDAPFDWGPRLEPGPSIFLSPVPPSISADVTPPVIFEDESATYSRSVSNAAFATFGSTGSARYVVPDLSDPSGLKQGGGMWGSGGGPPCVKPSCMTDTWTIEGKVHQQQHMRFSIYAETVLGLSSKSQRWLDILSPPTFKGACSAPYSGYSSRANWIRGTLKAIDKKLRSGCIVNDSGMDKTVLAFKDGHLTRQEIWAALLLMLQNSKQITFHCEETTNKNAPPASFQPYSNNLYFRWKPTYNLGPTEYALVHELVHKAGFHDTLLKHYLKASIETQADLVATACTP